MSVACKTQSKGKLEPRNNALSISNDQTIRRFITDEFDRLWLVSDHKNKKENAPASDQYLLGKSSAVYLHLCKNYKVR